MRSISDLVINEKAFVVQVEQNQAIAKFIALGLVPGTEIQLVRKSPLGDAYYIKLSNHQIGIREEEAKLIRVEDLQIYN